MAPSKSSKSPAFQFYPRDFLSSSKVERMSMTERGIYITLLSRCWLDGGLPTDLRELSKFARMKPTQFERLWTNGPLAQCFYQKGDQLQHERLDKERKIQAEYRKRQKDAATKRWESHGNATAMPSVASTRHPSGNAPLPQSAIRDPQSASTRGATLIPKRRPYAAFEGPRVYVPQSTHANFIGFRNHPGAEKELLDWYERVSNEWTTGARKDDPGFDADMVRFWKARYAEEWPTATVDKRRPSWAV